MNFCSNILLIISIFLATLFIEYQAYEGKELSENSELLNLKLNDKSYSSRNIREVGYKFSIINGYNENNNQQKRHVSGNKSKYKAKKRVKRISKRKKEFTKSTTPPYKSTTTVTIKKSRIPVGYKYIKMKFDLYNDINELRKENHMPPLRINTTLSLELQKNAVKFINDKKKLKSRKSSPKDLFYYCYADKKYDPIDYWFKNEPKSNKKSTKKGNLNQPVLKLISNSSKYIACGVYGDEKGIDTYCKITP